VFGPAGEPMIRRASVLAAIRDGMPRSERGEHEEEA
jgi:hypothetical protein